MIFFVFVRRIAICKRRIEIHGCVLRVLECTAHNPNNRRNKSGPGRSRNKGSSSSSNRKNKNDGPHNSHYKQLRVPQNSKERKDVWFGTTSGLEFEDACADILERCGFRVKKMGGVSDGGRDIIIWNNKTR